MNAVTDGSEDATPGLDARPTVLLICYKIERGKGSEDGSGYHLACEYARSPFQLVLISRRNNIQKLVSDPAFAGVELVSVDVPRWLGFFKRRNRGIIAYYYLWQVCVGRVVRRLTAGRPIAVVHQLNFHADWAPHFLKNDNGTVVWGPVAHHRMTPWAFYPGADIRGRLADLLRTIVKWAFWHLDPLSRSTPRRSDVVFAANPLLAPHLGRYSSKVSVCPYAGSYLKGPPIVHKVTQEFKVLWVGRLVPMKGAIIALDAFAAFLRARPGISAQLAMVGSGPLREHLVARARTLGIDDRVSSIGWETQDQLAEHYLKSSVFLYPSVEAQGLVVAEAVSAGLPVLCLDKTGPATVAGEAGVTVSFARPRKLVADRLAIALAELYDEFSERPGDYLRRRAGARDWYEKNLDWSQLAGSMLTACGLPSRATGRGGAQ